MELNIKLIVHQKNFWLNYASNIKYCQINAQLKFFNKNKQYELNMENYYNFQQFINLFILRIILNIINKHPCSFYFIMINKFLLFNICNFHSY